MLLISSPNAAAYGGRCWKPPPDGALASEYWRNFYEAATVRQVVVEMGVGHEPA